MSGTRAAGLGRRIGLGLIWIYRNGVSPFKPACCRFEPSCSQYAAEAVARFGLMRGAFLAVRRLVRCHPFHRGPLHDPVPEAGVSSAPVSAAGRRTAALRQRRRRHAAGAFTETGADRSAGVSVATDVRR